MRKSIKYLLFLATIGSCANWRYVDIDDNVTVAGVDSVASIAIIPSSGTFSGPVLPVQIQTTTNYTNPSTHYTTDGSTPTCSSPLYSGIIVISSDSEITAIVCNSENIVSEPSEEQYSLVAFTGNWFGVSGASMTASSEDARRTQITTASDDSVYIAYTDTHHNIKVKTVNNSAWQELGTASLPSPDTYINLKLDTNDTPYIAYDTLTNRKASVVKFNGTTWEQLGNLDFSSYAIEDIQLAISPSNDIFVSFLEYDPGDDKYYLKVMKYNSNTSSWEYVTGQGFPQKQEAPSLSRISFDSNSNLYLAYGDGTKLTVLSYDGTNWTELGSNTINANIVYISIDTDINNDVYVAFSDANNGYKGSVVKLNKSNNNWEILGTQYFSSSSVEHISLKITPDGIPSIAFADGSKGRGINVKLFNGTTWEELSANSQLDNGMILYSSIASDSNNKLYVIYHSYNESHHARVFQLNISPKTPTFNIYNRTFVNADSLSLELTSDEDYTSTYYTLDGSTPSSTNGTLYEEAFSLSDSDNSKILKAITYGDMFPDDSKIVSFKYIFKPSNDWHSVGNFAFSSAEANYTDLAIDDGNNVYVVFQNHRNNNTTTVMKHDKNSDVWSVLENESISDPIDTASQQRIIIDTDHNKPYVVYTDSLYKDGLAIKSFDGTDWNNVGSQGFAMATFFDIALDSSKTLFIAYKDTDTDGSAKVVYFDGNDWKDSGGSNFDNKSISEIAITIDDKDVLFATVTNPSDGNILRVYKLDGNKWISLGGDITHTAVEQISIAHDNKDIFVTCYEPSSKNILIKKYIESKDIWEDLGITPATGIFKNLKLGVNSLNEIYLSYIDHEHADQANLLKYDGVKN